MVLGFRSSIGVPGRFDFALLWVGPGAGDGRRFFPGGGAVAPHRGALRSPQAVVQRSGAFSPSSICLEAGRRGNGLVEPGMEVGLEQTQLTDAAKRRAGL